MSQALVRSVEFGGFPDEPWLRVDEHTYRLGENLRGRHGFAPFAVLGPRLLRIVVALTIARTLDRKPDRGWRSAEEIAANAEPATSPDATRRFLWERLRGYTVSPEEEIEFRRVPDTHLVQYLPQRRTGHVLAHGRSRGPYRLGVPPASVTLDVESGLAFLGHSMIQSPLEERDLVDAMTRAKELAERSDYASARAVILGGLVHGARTQGEKRFHDLVADAYYQLGHWSMQLGLSREAIRSARRARSLYETLRHPAGVASTLITESHAESQLGNEIAALGTAKQARAVLDNAAPQRRRLMRTGYVGVVGQRYARLRRFAAAERNLLGAFHLAQDVDDTLKVYTWAVRRVENFVWQHDLSAAERVLADAHDFHARYAITGVEGAILWRVTASFMLASGRLDEAVRWTTRAKDFALSHRLGNELGRLTPAITAIECAGAINVL